MPTPVKIGQRYRNRRSRLRAEVIGFTRKGGIRRAKLRHEDGAVTLHQPPLTKNYVRVA